MQEGAETGPGEEDTTSKEPSGIDPEMSSLALPHTVLLDYVLNQNTPLPSCGLVLEIKPRPGCSHCFQFSWFPPRRLHLLCLISWALGSSVSSGDPP